MQEVYRVQGWILLETNVQFTEKQVLRGLDWESSRVLPDCPAYSSNLSRCWENWKNKRPNFRIRVWEGLGPAITIR